MILLLYESALKIFIIGPSPQQEFVHHAGEKVSLFDKPFS
jgi:hypothetical protein